MLRRDFLKVIGAMGVIATLPIGAIAEVKEYPKISYEVDYRPEWQTYLHQVHGKIDGIDWVIAEYSDDKVLPNNIFLRMVDEINKKVIST